MPQVIRLPVRMDCAGLDISHPVDRQPPDTFPLLSNVRVIEEGRIEGRPGYTVYDTAPPSPPFPTNKNFHTIRRLNDPNDSLAPTGYIDIVGNGAALDAGPQGALAIIDTGYSGNPLSLITFRPEQSTESWMYVYDKNKQIKVRPDAAIRNIGIAPASTAPKIDYGVPASADIATMQDITGWNVTQSFGTQIRAGGNPGIGTILYNSGTTGWCCINPSITGGFNFQWASSRMKLQVGGATGGIGTVNATTTAVTWETGTPFNVTWTGTITINGLPYTIATVNSTTSITLTAPVAGGPLTDVSYSFGTGEEIFVRDVIPPITSTTIAGILYDNGTSGACAIVLAGNPAGLVRNSLLSLTNGASQTDIVRVLEVILSPDGSVYSLRCSTTHTFAAGNVAVGLESWYVYTALTHVTGELFYSSSISIIGFTGVTTASLTSNINASVANGRPIDPANDWLSIGLFLTVPTNVVNIQLLVSLDAVPNFSFTNPGNSWIWTITQDQLVAMGLTAGNSFENWYEVQIPISSGVQNGSPSLTFASISGVAVQLTTTGNCGWAFDWWYLFGTYGPVIQPNSPVGYIYQSVDRDSTTGAESVPSPQNRYELFPLREAIVVTPATTLALGVDSLDIYRQGGTLTGFVYVGTVVNNNASPNSYIDGIPDTSILASPAPDLTKIQPWPLLDYEWVGTVNVVGTSVHFVSGQDFKPNLLSATVILINGIAYQTYGQPRNLTLLELFTDAGVQNGVPFLIASPTLAGQPLPYAFGPLEGPLAPVVFALGDPIGGGNLYWTNFSDGDSADDANFLEIAAPSEPLISGQVWNGIVIVGSRDNVFLVRYSFVTNSVYQFNRIPSPSGMWTRWASCRGPDGVYFLGRDGIYLATEAGAKSITDGQLYPLFPHDGAPAVGSPSLAAVDMSQVGKFMRLSAGMFEIFFDYLDVNGTQNTLRFDIPKQRWFHHSYGDRIISHYLVDEGISLPSSPQILLVGATSGNIYSAGGNDDDGTAIVSQAQLPYMDGGEERGQLLPSDYIVDSDGTGVVNATQSYNNGVTVGPTQTFSVAGSRIQGILNISNVPNILTLYRNLSVLLSWTGGPAGPRIYAVEPAFYRMPYLSTRVLTQYIGMDSPGTWIHLRRLYAGLISTSPVVFTVTTQDQRTYSVTIPSTNGQFSITPIMMPQNCKFLSAALELDSSGVPFALFPESFTPETKFWQEPSYIALALFKT